MVGGWQGHQRQLDSASRYFHAHPTHPHSNSFARFCDKCFMIEYVFSIRRAKWVHFEWHAFSLCIYAWAMKVAAPAALLWAFTSAQHEKKVMVWGIIGYMMGMVRRCARCLGDECNFDVECNLGSLLLVAQLNNKWIYNNIFGTQTNAFLDDLIDN